MKIKQFFISEHEGELSIQMEAETQEETSQLVEACNRLKGNLRVYGRIDKDRTWAWLSLPIKKKTYEETMFGKDK